MNTAKLACLAKTFRILGNAKRLEILYAIIDKELSVGQLERVVKLSQSALSQHLAILRNGDVVKTRRVAQTIFYILKDENIKNLLLYLQSIDKQIKS